MKYEVLIFDFDGTISDTFAHIRKIGEKIAPEFGIDPSKIDEEDIAKLKKMSFKEIHRHFGIKFYQLPFLIMRGKEEFNKIANEVKLIPDMDDVIKELHTKEATLGILTSNNVENVKKVLSNHKLEYFEFIEESERMGEKGKILQKIIEEKSFAKRSTIYIGDEPRDIIAAKKAGISSAGVTWGLKNKDDLQAEGPDFIFEQPEEIFSIA